jgi:hypothetical protein
VRGRLCATLAVALVLVAGCGDGGGGGGGDGDDELVRLLRDQGGQPAPVATCVAERLVEAGVDRDELFSIIRGEGSEDTDTAAAYGDATLACTLLNADPTLSTAG